MLYSLTRCDMYRVHTTSFIYDYGKFILWITVLIYSLSLFTTAISVGAWRNVSMSAASNRMNGATCHYEQLSRLVNSAIRSFEI